MRRLQRRLHIIPEFCHSVVSNLRCCLPVILLGISVTLRAQGNVPDRQSLQITNTNADTTAVYDTISREEVSRIMHILAGDSLEGRGNFQPGLLKAAKFIGASFREMGLQPLPGQASYFIPFRPAGGRRNEAPDLLRVNGKQQTQGSFLYFHTSPGNYTPRALATFRIRQVDGFSASTLADLPADTSAVLIWSRPGMGRKKKLQDLTFIMPRGGLNRDVLLLVSDSMPSSLELRGNDAWYSNLDYNIAAMLPGRTESTLLLSAHYDHEGIIAGQPDDNIMNGANDNASGTTALMTIARTLSGRHDNERSVVFVAFAAEELGLVGSLFFTEHEQLQHIDAVINFEMLGIPQLGARTVFITGQYDSNLPRLLAKELSSNGLKVKDDPVPDKLLYERSDNYPFALKDIPAHSIMASTDDDECYHQFCDDPDRIDMDNLTAVINAIASSMIKFVNGTFSKAELR